MQHHIIQPMNEEAGTGALSMLSKGQGLEGRAEGED